MYTATSSDPNLLYLLYYLFYINSYVYVSLNMKCILNIFNLLQFINYNYKTMNF